MRVDKRRVVLGRSRECDIQVEDPNVSRRHAELRQEGSAYWIVDLDSTNGIEVNGRRVQAREARVGRHLHRRLDRDHVLDGARMSLLGEHDVRERAARPEGRVPRPALSLHLAHRPHRRDRPAAAAGELHPAARARRRRDRPGGPAPAGSSSMASARPRRGRRVRARRRAAHDRPRRAERRARSRRRVRVGAPRAHRAAARRRLGARPRLDERHVRERRAHRPAAQARRTATSSASARPS